MKKILIVHSNPFFPLEKGSDKVIYEYCKLLKKKGCDLYYCSTGQCVISEDFSDFFDGNVFIFKKNKYSLKNIISKAKKIVRGIKSPDDLYPIGLEKFVRQLNNTYSFDYCIINYIILSKLYLDCDIPRKVLFTHDVFTNKKEILGVDSFWLSLKPNQESSAIRRCTDIISIQENESVLFHYYNPHANIYTVFSPFKITYQNLTYNNNILFLSSNNQLNRNGIIWFIENVFPLVLKKISDAKLIVGGGICNSLSDYQSENIILEGYINNVADFYKFGDIVINPIYQGTGLKVKTFEALSFGKLVITHKHSVEGIFDRYSAPIFFADTAPKYAELLIKTLNSSDRKTVSEKSIEYIDRLNCYVNSEYDNLLNKQ